MTDVEGDVVGEDVRGRGWGGRWRTEMASLKSSVDKRPERPIEHASSFRTTLLDFHRTAYGARQRSGTGPAGVFIDRLHQGFFGGGAIFFIDPRHGTRHNRATRHCPGCLVAFGKHGVECRNLRLADLHGGCEGETKLVCKVACSVQHAARAHVHPAEYSPWQHAFTRSPQLTSPIPPRRHPGPAVAGWAGICSY